MFSSLEHGIQTFKQSEMQGADAVAPQVEAVGKRLERAQHLLYDLVPRHIANALLNQPQPHHNSTGFSAGDSSLLDGQLGLQRSPNLPSTTGSASGIISSPLGSASALPGGGGGHPQDLLFTQPSYEIPASEVLRPTGGNHPLAPTTLVSHTPSRPPYKRQPSDLPEGTPVPSDVQSSMASASGGRAQPDVQGYTPSTGFTFISGSACGATPELPMKSSGQVWSLSQLSAGHCPCSMCFASSCGVLQLVKVSGSGWVIMFGKCLFSYAPACQAVAPELHGESMHPHSSGLDAHSNTDGRQLAADAPAGPLPFLLHQDSRDPPDAEEDEGSCSYMPSWPGSGFSLANLTHDDTTEQGRPEASPGPSPPVYLGAPFGSDLLHQGSSLSQVGQGSPGGGWEGPATAENSRLCTW
jgi:hypothetical protein